MSCGFASNRENTCTPAGSPARKASNSRNASSGWAASRRRRRIPGARGEKISVARADRRAGYLSQRAVTSDPKSSGAVSTFAGGEEAFGQAVDLFDPGGQVGLERGDRSAHEGGQPGETVVIGGQVMRLGVADHLNAVFDLAVGRGNARVRRLQRLAVSSLRRRAGQARRLCCAPRSEGSRPPR